MTTNPLIYLASPYSDNDPAVVEARYAAALQVVRSLLARGRLVYSPIVYGHVISADGGVPTTWETWAAFDSEVLSRCDMVYVLMLPGWMASRGVRAEIREAERLGIPVRYVYQEDLND